MTRKMRVIDLQKQSFFMMRHELRSLYRGSGVGFVVYDNTIEKIVGMIYIGENGKLSRNQNSDLKMTTAEELVPFIRRRFTFYPAAFSSWEAIIF